MVCIKKSIKSILKKLNCFKATIIETREEIEPRKTKNIEEIIIKKLEETKEVVKIEKLEETKEVVEIEKLEETKETEQTTNIEEPAQETEGAEGTKKIEEPQIIEYCSVCWQVKKLNCRCENDYGRCHDCGELNINYNWCQNCKPLLIMPTFSWTSGNSDIDKLIQEAQLKPRCCDWHCWRWIEYSELENIQYLSEGGFGTVNRAAWPNVPEGYFVKEVAIKHMKNSQNVSKEFIKELKAYHEHTTFYIINIYGITKDPQTNEFGIVMPYYHEGDLKSIIRKRDKQMDWKYRLNSLYQIAGGLDILHKNGFVHCDLHPGNILNNDPFTYLSDLGLCKPANYKSNSDEVFGIIPYLAPEVLCGQPFSAASDVYSFGIILWEFTSRIPPFSDIAHDEDLVLNILSGVRPKIVKGTPDIYVNLMESCWKSDPSERMKSPEIFKTISAWHNNEVEIFREMFKKADKEMIVTPELPKQHPGAHYSSRSVSQYINSSKYVTRDIKDNCEELSWSVSDLVIPVNN
ncbi:hypothetical protein Glove_22g111 [Diversispora epigaea]|uniref:Protein kinase domain-containing protein n=1 Tax=Diversispora epigaea TaxID=1348612 RepID=A0A397JKP3_9GLOM|nr:hypothetical protein Glove_22g111 [Diversispora epigaea]